MGFVPPRDASTGSLLEVTGLRTEVRQHRSWATAVNGVSFRISAGETLGLVGESGSGKSLTGMSVLRLLQAGTRMVGGSVRLRGQELTSLDERGMRAVRGNDIAVVFQNPMTSLNPTMTIGRQVAGPVRIHRRCSWRTARERAAEVLGLVGMPRPAERLDDYPHQLSGGMRQRALLAIALACDPGLLIADEPTTALDVTIQAQVLELLDSLRASLDMGVLLITHDMGVIAGRTDRVMVMYAGRIVESGSTESVFASPRHPYTEALLGAIPKLEQDRAQPLYTVGGQPPELAARPAGCGFAPRCRYVSQRCVTEAPPLANGPDGHAYACSPAPAPRARIDHGNDREASRAAAGVGGRRGAPGPAGHRGRAQGVSRDGWPAAA